MHVKAAKFDYLLSKLTTYRGQIRLQNSFKFSVLFFILSLSTLPAHALLNARMLQERDPSGPSRGVVQMAIMRGNWRATFCTATLIARNAVLTAGHCFDHNLVGDFDSFEIVFETFENNVSRRTSLKGTAHFTHPKYAPFQRPASILHTDIAVAFFDGDIPEGFAPVPFDTNTKSNYAKRAVQVFGYGRGVDYTGELNENRVFSSDILRTATLYISENYYSYYPDLYYLLPHPRNPSFLCQGDSGGPQFLVTKKSFKLIGVNSGGGITKSDGSGASSCKGAGVAAKVAPAAKWIQQLLESNQ